MNTLLLYLHAVTHPYTYSVCECKSYIHRDDRHRNTIVFVLVLYYKGLAHYIARSINPADFTRNSYSASALRGRYIATVPLTQLH